MIAPISPRPVANQPTPPIQASQIPAAVLARESDEQSDVVRTVAFYMGLALVFVKFALLQEVLTVVLGFNTYVLYVFGLPALLGVLVSGGTERTLRESPARLWVAYAVWLAITVPLSSWPGGSFQLVSSYWRTELPILFVIAGLAVRWTECWLLMKTIGVACLVNIASSRIFGASTGNGRLELEFGGVSNANDFAGHLLLVLPFLLFLIYAIKSYVLRLVLLPVWVYGVLAVLKTASRGALIAIVAACLFVILRGTNRQRVVLLSMVPLVLIVALASVNRDALVRLGAMSGSARNAATGNMTGDQQTVEGAAESTEARRYLMMKALEYSVRYPLAGVGVGQFSNFEGSHNKVLGFEHGSYHNVHSSFLAPFAEAGLLGGALHLAAYLVAFLWVNRTYRQARLRTDCDDIRAATFYVMLATVTFCAAILFLNFAYAWYGPVLAGISISVSRAGEHEMERRKATAL